MTLDEVDEAYCTLLVDLRDPSGTMDATLNDRIERAFQGRGDAVASRDYVGVLADAMTLVPLGAWFHWSHLGFSVIPTRLAQGVPMSDAVDHHPEGSMSEGAPVAYEASATDSAESRAALPRMVCLAVTLARRAAVIKALARRDGRHRLVQTGGGPLIASSDGVLVELPQGCRLTRDGRIVPHDGRDGTAWIEDPHA